MRVLLTRPEADARRGAARLESLGHETILAPLFEIASTGAPAPDSNATRLLATSAHAFGHLTSDTDFANLRIDIVGERTATAARDAGFSQIGIVAPDAKTLAVAIAREGGGAQDFLYLAGRERRPELEAALAALGHRVTPWIVYETRETPDTRARLIAIWRAAQVDAVLHFSPRSAALYMAAAQDAGLVQAALAPAQIAISARAAEALAGAQDLRIAPTPDFDGLLACL